MRILPLLLASGLAIPAAARAQDVPRVEVFGGYSYMRIADESFHGWEASLTYNLSGALALEGDVSGHYSGASGTDSSRLSFLAGPRLCWRSSSVTPFVHVLVGGVRTSSGVTVFDVSISASDTSLGGAVGGGLELKLGSRWSARLQGDYVLVRAEGASGENETSGDPRVSLGAVLRFGRR
jgi:opacity protein-like surface antigen